MKIMTIIILLYSSLLIAQDCLPSRLGHIRDNKDYLLLTTKGDTMLQAEMNLRTQMPKLGLLEQVKITELKRFTNKSYDSKTIHEKRLKANVDMWLKYECKHKGQYYITAIVAKDDVQYVDFWYPKKDINLKNLQRACGKDQKIVLFLNRGGRNFASRTDKTYRITVENDRYDCDKTGNAHLYCDWYLMCGDVNLSLGFGHNPTEVNNSFDHFMVIGHTGKGRVEDYTVDFWLDMTKDM